MLGVILFDRVAVPLAGLRDAAENEDVALSVGAAGVVVAAYVQVRHFEPKVKVDVVLLAPLEGLVFFAARASDDKELVIEAAN